MMWSINKSGRGMEGYKGAWRGVEGHMGVHRAQIHANILQLCKRVYRCMDLDRSLPGAWKVVQLCRSTQVPSRYTGVQIHKDLTGILQVQG